MAFLRDNLVAILSSLITFAVTFGVIQTKVSYNSHSLADLEPRIRFMEVHGHENHEDRIRRLEEQKADRLSGLIEQQGKQITSLAETVRIDHDSITKLTTILERR